LFVSFREQSEKDTFDSFAPTNEECKSADKVLSLHTKQSGELAKLLESIIHNDALFRQIGKRTGIKQGAWNLTIESIKKIT
jgi:hypothetical protein